MSTLASPDSAILWLPGRRRLPQGNNGTRDLRQTRPGLQRPGFIRKIRRPLRDGFRFRAAPGIACGGRMDGLQGRSHGPFGLLDWLCYRHFRSIKYDIVSAGVAVDDLME